MLLNIHNLTISVKGNEKPIVNKVNVRVPRGKIVALVGASGSGKTTVGLSILRLLDPALKIDHGEILWQGENLLQFTDREIRGIRGGKIATIFQEPLNAFNPVFTIYDQINEVMSAHTDLNNRDKVRHIKELLDQCGIVDVERIMKSYPHQLSGGLRQRSMIAQALAGNPELIIADEPTSSIDVTLQARVLDLFKTLKRKLNLSIVLITHDLGMVEHLADYVYVMSEGNIVEEGNAKNVIKNPSELYTQRLIEATL